MLGVINELRIITRFLSHFDDNICGKNISLECFLSPIVEGLRDEGSVNVSTRAE
jgi:hypothetical protein